MFTFLGGEMRYRWIVAQEGSRQSYAIPIAFHRLDALRMFYVDIWCRYGRGWLSRGPAGARALATRFDEQLPLDRVVSFSPMAAITRSLDHLRRRSYTPSDLAEVYCRFGRWFATRVQRHLETVETDPEKDVFFGFNTNCLEILGPLSGRGIFTVIDQVDPGKVEEDLVMEEVERWPGWARASGRMPQCYWDRIRDEWNMGDVILVNSEWSAKALVRQGVPRGKIIVVPLAIDLAHNHPVEPIKPEGTLKVLWLGSVILRKGIQYLVEAARLLRNEDVKFLLAGPIGVSDHARRLFPSNIEVLGRVTRDELTSVYQRAHAFVLPTISDGFAITQLEAMAHGLPVVATPNCGEVVTDGVDGFIVPPRDSEALAEAIVRLNRDRKRLVDMSAEALRTVRKYDLPSNALLIDRLVDERRAQAQLTEVQHG